MSDKLDYEARSQPPLRSPSDSDYAMDAGILVGSLLSLGLVIYGFVAGFGPYGGGGAVAIQLLTFCPAACLMIPRSVGGRPRTMIYWFNCVTLATVTLFIVVQAMRSN
ncbi:MAG: hypothetical protein JWM57_2354 [Phycisphaerales bacterium]|nr:hypothetical protein [Phycisphaerales bacterium]